MDGLKVGILGLAFKPGTDDVRDAPSLDLIHALVDEGAEVQAYDPEAVESARPNLPSSVQLVDSVEEAANRTQALVLLTEWDSIVQSDWRIVARCMIPPRLVFDGRNALDPSEMGRLGFEYVGVGRGPGPRCDSGWRFSLVGHAGVGSLRARHGAQSTLSEALFQWGDSPWMFKLLSATPCLSQFMLVQRSPLYHHSSRPGRQPAVQH